jgi:hypothetical protein
MKFLQFVDNTYLPPDVIFPVVVIDVADDVGLRMVNVPPAALPIAIVPVSRCI